jgi:hypothetical protein
MGKWGDDAIEGVERDETVWMDLRGFVLCGRGSDPARDATPCGNCFCSGDRQ